MLRADIQVSRGEFELAIDLDVPPGGVLAVLGPNGSGKSSLLDCLSGLLAANGTISIAGRPVHDLPPHQRGVGLLRQAPLLFPHMNVLQNVAFGPVSQGQSKERAREIASRWLADVGVAELAGRKPARISGGQAQRVALARALATRPSLLLLDEPLAALDVHAAPAMRALLRRVLRQGDERRAGVLVTHDPLDAIALADQVIVLADGRVVERGPTREVLAAPRTQFTARIAGLNLVSGYAVEDGLRTADGALLQGILAPDAVRGEPAVAVFAPSVIAVYPVGAGHGSPRNTAVATLASVEPHGPVVRLRTGTPGAGWAAGIAADLTPAAVAELGLEPGSQIEVSVKATAVEVHPATPPIARAEQATRSERP